MVDPLDRPDGAVTRPRVRQSGPGVPPSPPARWWQAAAIYLCCSALGATVVLIAPPGTGLGNMILRFATAGAILAITAIAAFVDERVANRRLIYCRRCRGTGELLDYVPGHLTGWTSVRPCPDCAPSEEGA